MTIPFPQQTISGTDFEVADQIRLAAHELLEPLLMAEAYVELVHDRLGAAEHGDSRRDLEILSGALSRARVVVDTLLYDAVAPDRELALRPVDLARVADDCVEQLAAEIRAREAALRIADLPVVRGDEALLGAVVKNLVANALKHGPRRGGTIELFAERERSRWRVGVASDGPAIPEAERVEIFLPYSRGSRGRATRGAGLGLAVCRRIIERHGGSIGVVSVATGGNVFFFTLPA